jgi:NADH:ubiquinone oxidoreductase subunit 2 (subunit N)
MFGEFVQNHPIIFIGVMLVLSAVGGFWYIANMLTLIDKYKEEEKKENEKR